MHWRLGPTCALLSLVGCATTVSPELCRQTIDEIYNQLDDDSRATLLEVESKEDVIFFHHRWGMGIRNAYGLWPAESPVRRSCARMVGESDLHPESASTVIMEGVWEKVHASQVKHTTIGDT